MATEGTLAITGSGDNAIYELTHTTSASGDYKALLNTKNTFVDKNISITITTPAIGAQTLDIADKTVDLSWGSSTGTAGSKTFSPTTTLTGTVTPATAGWATTGAQNVSESDVVVGKVPQIKVGVTASSANIKVTPTITRTARPSGDTWIDAASGAVTTTKPTSGVYVQVNAAAKAGSATVTGKVSTAGYGTTSDYAADNATTITGGTNAAANTYVPITTATPVFTGGTLSGDSTADATNATLVSTNNSGIAIQTKYTASSTAVTYNGEVAGWVSAASGDTALAGQTKASTNGTLYYLSAITIPSGKSLTITNNGTATVTTSGTANITSTGTTTVTSGSTSAGKITIAAKTATGDSSNTSQDVVTNGIWKTTTITANTTAAQTAYGRVVVNKLTGGTIAAVASDPGTGYTENSSVVLASGGWLRLTAGYYAATKISLATLVPNGSNIAGYANYLLDGYSAYDNDGNLVTGSMPTYDGSYTIS